MWNRHDDVSMAGAHRICHRPRKTRSTAEVDDLCFGSRNDRCCMPMSLHVMLSVNQAATVVRHTVIVVDAYLARRTHLSNHSSRR